MERGFSVCVFLVTYERSSYSLGLSYSMELGFVGVNLIPRLGCLRPLSELVTSPIQGPWPQEKGVELIVRQVPSQGIPLPLFDCV